jgi:hypothetical protein
VIFEREILRKIFGPTEELNGLWRINTNEELDELTQRKNIIRFIKSQRLKWLGHVARMPIWAYVCMSVYSSGSNLACTKITLPLHNMYQEKCFDHCLN